MFCKEQSHQLMPDVSPWKDTLPAEPCAASATSPPQHLYQDAPLPPVPASVRPVHQCLEYKRESKEVSLDNDPT